MWYYCLAVISLCKRCGLPYKWGFSHHLYQVNTGERIYPCRLIRCDGALGTGAVSAVLCWTQHKPSSEAQESWGGAELWVQSLFWVCKGFVGWTGTAALCNLLVQQVQPARHWHPTAERQNLQRNSGISPPLQGQNYSFQSGDCAVLLWGSPWVQKCCFCQLLL